MMKEMKVSELVQKFYSEILDKYFVLSRWLTLDDETTLDFRSIKVTREEVAQRGSGEIIGEVFAVNLEFFVIRRLAQKTKEKIDLV